MSGLRSGASGSRAVLLTSARVPPHRARNSPPPVPACNLPKISKRYRATRRLLPTRCCCACGALAAVAASCWAILPQRFVIRSVVHIKFSSASLRSLRAAHTFHLKRIVPLMTYPKFRYKRHPSASRCLDLAIDCLCLGQFLRPASLWPALSTRSDAGRRKRSGEGKCGDLPQRF